jgi:quinol monooxygenase YgiN
MKSTIRFTVELDIADGKKNEFERVTRTMADRTMTEPGAIEYDFYISADGKRCRLLETYAGAEAVLAHLKGPVVQELVPQMLAVSSLTRFEVYGDPGAEAAQMLAGLGAAIHSRLHHSQLTNSTKA